MEEVDCTVPFNSDFTRFLNKDPNMNYSKKELNELMNNSIPNINKYIDGYNNCILSKIQYRNDNMSKFFDQSQRRNSELTTAEQVNLETIQLYQNDYYYVIIKCIIYLIVLGVFIYMFGIRELVEGIKTTTSVTTTAVKDAAIKVKDTAINVKDKLNEIK